MTRILLVLLTLAACAPTTQRPEISRGAVSAEAFEQEKMALRVRLDTLERLNGLYYGIARAGADLCTEKKTWSIGATFAQISHEEESARLLWTALFAPGLSPDDVFVLSVAKGSPAERAGLRPLDIVTAIKDGAPGTDPVRAAIKDGRPLTLTVNRPDAPGALSITPEVICHYPIGLITDRSLNAFADGERIVIHSGMADFAGKDEELALVISHELAHNLRGHIETQTANQVGGQIAGGILDTLAALAGVNTSGAFSKAAGRAAGSLHSVAFESEADYVGLYLMARAGYPIDGAAQFWRRMAIAHPDMITRETSHPATAERFVAIEATVAEIKAKQKAGVPLVPNEARPPAETRQAVAP
jgi:hypothetical protein